MSKRGATGPPQTGKRKQRSGDDSDDDDNYGDGEDFGDDAAEEDVDAAEQVASQQEEISKEIGPERPPVPASFDTNTDIYFQKLQIDTVIGPSVAGMPGIQGSSVPIIRMYGTTAEGHSVRCNVHGFLPYFYAKAPPGFTKLDCETFANALNQRVIATQKGRPGDYVVQVELCQKKSIMGYHENPDGFLEIVVCSPSIVPKCRTILMDGFSFGGTTRRYGVFECDMPYVLRYMIDHSIVGAGWVRIVGGEYRLRKAKASHCQFEVDVAFDRVLAMPCDSGEFTKISPFRIMSFDIECAGRKGVFPAPEIDKVIQIASCIVEHGKKEPIFETVFTLNTCDPIEGAQVVSFKTEEEMLLAWRDLVVRTDPDMFTGYNINNFDFPYLINRANTLGVGKAFSLLGRNRGVRSELRATTFTSKAYGTKNSFEVTMDGRTFFDMLAVIQRDHKLRSYTLNAVSSEFLGEQKEDVHHSIITDLQNGSNADRRRLAVYCLKDARLPLRLMNRLMTTYNMIEMARVTGVPLSFLLSRGQQIKVLSQLYRRTLKDDFVVPYYQVERGAGTGDEAAYEGATVIEPKRGFYETPIATLDFASLYPSIMMAHNLCYCTLLSAAEAASMPADDYERTPTGALFLKNTKRRGILPMILEDLLAARKRAKNELKAETDPAKKAVLDGRQLALKVSANSVYGFTGATIGKLPCLDISASVTAYGREMIEATKNHVEATYTVANGYSHDAVVIYGDTDSVMVKFGDISLEEAMRLGKQAAQEVTKKFVKPIGLEFEKCYYPYLLINKKRYAGQHWTNPKEKPKIDAKGIEVVRRDNCPLVKQVLSECLDLILRKKDVKAAIELVQRKIGELLRNELDLSLLVITKALSREAEDYAGKQAHVELAARMRKRDAGSAPNIGDRVPYVIIKAAKGAPAFEKSEDPLWVLENNIPIDYDYYIHNQLEKPLLRIFDPIIPNAASVLFHGEHTRKITVVTPSSNAGGIMSFTVKRPLCIECNVPLKVGQKAVCADCEPNIGEIYQGVVAHVKEIEQQHARVWTQCQDCQKSHMAEIICSNRDCPIFYARCKTRKDLADAQAQLQRFDW